MTPKEKAEFLISRFEIIAHPTIDCDKQFAKQCALIAVDEILGSMGADRGYAFWQEVKHELQNL